MKALVLFTEELYSFLIFFLYLLGLAYANEK